LITADPFAVIDGALLLLVKKEKQTLEGEEVKISRLRQNRPSIIPERGGRRRDGRESERAYTVT
jgi:hypothetical protein